MGKRPAEVLFPELAALKAQGLCPVCQAKPTTFRDELSRKEFGISGLCQSCQDKYFEPHLSDIHDPWEDP